MQKAGLKIPALDQTLHDEAPRKSMEAVEYCTLEWVDRNNHRRLREPIKDVAPAEADANYFAALKETAIAA